VVVLEDKYSNENVILFGIGLVGQAILDELVLAEYQVIFRTSVKWQTGDIKEEEELLTIPLNRKKNISTAKIIWSAGRAGFSSSNEEIQSEFSVFQNVNWRIINHCKKHYDQVVYKLISSAGGLYEMNYINRDIDNFSIMRPYGKLKRMQERYLLSLVGIIILQIYRITTVYSNSLKNGRKGLISVLMKNLYLNQVSPIYANPNTIRDYVLDSDVARYVVNHTSDSSTVKILCTCDIFSINQIVLHLERQFGKKAYANFNLLMSNSVNIIFHDSLKPHDFKHSSLLTNLRIFHNNILGYGA